MPQTEVVLLGYWLNVTPLIIFLSVLAFRVITKNSDKREYHFYEAQVVVVPCCNPLPLQPEQSGGQGSNPTSTFERHDKG